MTKIQMPDPVAYQWLDTGHFRKKVPADADASAFRALITTDQAEAYANQRVKQALEEAIIEVMRCKTSGIIRNDTVDKCADAIRALIPATKAADYATAKAREAQQWQPIETAPQDGTFILAINAAKNPDLQHVVRYSERWGKHYPWVTGSGAMDFVAGVTHWMPLPPPPVG